jgi:hypothetical protein
MNELLSQDNLLKLAAAYAGIQMIANGIMIVMGESRAKTKLFKLCKLIVAGPRRAAPAVEP